MDIRKQIDLDLSILINKNLEKIVVLNFEKSYKQGEKISQILKRLKMEEKIFIDENFLLCVKENRYLKRSKKPFSKSLTLLDMVK